MQGIYHSLAFQDKDGSAGETAANKAPHLLQSVGTVTWGVRQHRLFAALRES